MAFFSSMNLSRLSLIAGLAGCFVITSYLTLYWDSNPPASLLTSTDPNQVVLYADDAYGIKFNDEGKLTETFRSPHVVRTQSGRTVMTTPILEMHSRDGDTWKGVAREGILLNDNEVELNGEVVITNPQQALQLNTEQLRYFSDRQEVTSDVAVLIHKDKDTTQRGIGMRADLNRNRVELLQRVEGTYVQP